jgi:hypothetical protein
MVMDPNIFLFDEMFNIKCIIMHFLHKVHMMKTQSNGRALPFE